MDEIETLNHEIQKLKRMLEIICERVGVDIETLEREAKYAKCIVCDTLYDKDCSCGCDDMACSCFAIFNSGNCRIPTMYFYNLGCMEYMMVRSSTPFYLKREIDDFIKRWKAQHF